MLFVPVLINNPSDERTASVFFDTAYWSAAGVFLLVSMVAATSMVFNRDIKAKEWPASVLMLFAMMGVLGVIGWIAWSVRESLPLNYWTITGWLFFFGYLFFLGWVSVAARPDSLKLSFFSSVICLFLAVAFNPFLVPENDLSGYLPHVFSAVSKTMQIDQTFGFPRIDAIKGLL